MSEYKEHAKSILVHYFRLLATKSGVKWDRDNEIEITFIVDDIIAAVKEELEGGKE